MIVWVIERSSASYYPRGFSVERSRRVPAQAQAVEIVIKSAHGKRPTKAVSATARPCMFTWSRVGHPPDHPVSGQRHNAKILGGIELWHARFGGRIPS